MCVWMLCSAIALPRPWGAVCVFIEEERAVRPDVCALLATLSSLALEGTLGHGDDVVSRARTGRRSNHALHQD